jgi:hypothetical protein
MRLNRKTYLAAFAFSLITLPAWAAHTDSLPWVAIEPTAIGTAHLMPGHYQLRAEEGQFELQVISGGKVIATVPCHWTQITNKAANSEVQTNNNQVTQVRFAGRTEAIQFNQ